MALTGSRITEPYFSEKITRFPFKLLELSAVSFAGNQSTYELQVKVNYYGSLTAPVRFRANQWQCLTFLFALKFLYTVCNEAVSCIGFLFNELYNGVTEIGVNRILICLFRDNKTT